MCWLYYVLSKRKRYLPDVQRNKKCVLRHHYLHHAHGVGQYRADRLIHGHGRDGDVERCYATEVLHMQL